MTSETDISDIEIKLINATRKFARQNILCVKIDEFYTDMIRRIGLRESGNNSNKIYIEYSGNGEKGGIFAHANNLSDLQKYLEFLKQEVPEVERRIKISD